MFEDIKKNKIKFTIDHAPRSIKEKFKFLNLNEENLMKLGKNKRDFNWQFIITVKYHACVHAMNFIVK